MPHLLIADAGPLIGLARIQQLVLLRHMFGKVTITTVVAEELGLGLSAQEQALQPGLTALLEAAEAGWLSIHAPDDSSPYQPLNPGVDAGEASAISLALRQHEDGEEVLMLIDDRCGRAEARHRGLALIGTAALVVLAKEQKLIEACAPLLSALRQEGYYLGDGLIQAVLHQADEG